MSKDRVSRLARSSKANCLINKVADFSATNDFKRLSIASRTSFASFQKTPPRRAQTRQGGVKRPTLDLVVTVGCPCKSHRPLTDYQMPVVSGSAFCKFAGRNKLRTNFWESENRNLGGGGRGRDRAVHRRPRGGGGGASTGHHPDTAARRHRRADPPPHVPPSPTGVPSSSWAQARLELGLSLS